VLNVCAQIKWIVICLLGRMSVKHKRMDHFYCLYQYDDTMLQPFICFSIEKQTRLNEILRENCICENIDKNTQTSISFDFFIVPLLSSLSFLLVIVDTKQPTSQETQAHRFWGEENIVVISSLGSDISRKAIAEKKGEMCRFSK
jgi:hypothetical protein